MDNRIYECRCLKEIKMIIMRDVSQYENLINAFKSGVDVHTLTASKVFGVTPEEVTKDMRRKAKAVNFGIVYGQSKYGLAKNLNISADEAQDFIDKYFKLYPKVKKYMEEKRAFVNEYGYVETMFGRVTLLLIPLMMFK